MKAHRLISRAPRRIEVEAFDLGPLPDGAILVRNDYTAVSVGTEIYNWLHGSEPEGKPSFPRTTGYCSAGTVIDVGKSVQGIAPGDRVAGQGNHASHGILSRNWVKLPGNLGTKPAAFMVMGAIAIHGVRVARIELGESVVVFGLGIVGQLAATLAALSGGCPVIGVDINRSRLDRAVHRGCDVGLDPAEFPDLAAEVRTLCPDDGANVVIEATGLPKVYPTAVSLACLAGRMVALGSPRGSVEFDFNRHVHLREVAIYGAHQPKTPNDDHPYYRFHKDRERALVVRLMATGRLPVEDLITHVARPENAQDVYTMLADDPREALGVAFAW
jgi:2-desacetyl-2-hydroxyethyl bacteriochlorophyllide A dehydrogenase